MMLWDIFLLLLGLALAAVGIVSPSTAFLWLGLAIVLLVVAWFREGRPSLHHLLQRLGILRARSPGAKPAETTDPAAMNRARIFRQGSEAPRKQAERQAIQKEARQISGTYRSMAVLNDVLNTPPSTRASMLERVMALQRQRDDYAERWTVVLPDSSNYSPLVPPVEPDWLEFMARDADALAWQLDHENGGTVRDHVLLAVGGTRSSCSCGQTFDTGPAFAQHQRTASSLR